MKSILAVALLAGIVTAEVPSHSYLPPPPRGYPQASSPPPSVISARNLNLQNPDQNNDHYNPDHHGDHQNHDRHNGDHVDAVRSSPQYENSTPVPQVRYSDDQVYDQNASGYPRNGLEDANTTVNYDSEEQGYPKSFEGTSDFTRSSGYNENANIIRSTDNYNQDGRNNGYQGNGQNGDRYGVTDQNGGRYQQDQNGSARSNFN